MNYKELQQAIKNFKAQGLTNIKLNAKKAELEAEYERLTAPKNEKEDLLKAIAKYLENKTEAEKEAFYKEIKGTEKAKKEISDEEILETIEELDRELGTENYLPIYQLRAKLNMTREVLDKALFRLESQDKIELSSLVEASNYTNEQINAGISQNIGGRLFFIIRY